VRRASIAAFAAAGLWLAVSAGASAAPEGIHKIEHVVVIMQENRSFDSYFGTYPGAHGIPAGVCLPDPLHGGCVAPFHDPDNENYGGPHGHGAFTYDLDGDKMDNFVAEAEKGLKCSSTEPGCSPCTEQASAGQCVDSMGYHDARELPNYWTYAQDFVLDDHMFEPVKSWSLPDHLYLVSGWSARCQNASPMSCVNNIVGPYGAAQFDRAVDQELRTGTTSIDLAWTDLTWLMFEHHVSWAYYVQTGTQPDCDDDSAETCAPVAQSATTPGIWNPLPLFGGRPPCVGCTTPPPGGPKVTCKSPAGT
jgi:phospholipase C